jgi:tetratricopeptide (TPR) repeat protein
LFANQPRFWALTDRLGFPGLPLEHALYQKEREMRYGKSSEMRYGKSSETNAPNQTTIRTLAVLPFENAKAGDTESQWLSTTLPEALKKHLKPLLQLEIKPAGFSGVDATVKGTFVQEADQLHVSVSLVNHARQTTVVLDNYTKPAINILQLQEDIAIGVAEKIRSNLTEEERKAIAQQRNIDPEAYIAYRRGLEYFDTFTAVGFAQAKVQFERARHLDPAYVDPVAYLATTQWVPAIWGISGATPKEGFRKAREIMAVAERLDASSFQVQGGRGWIEMLGYWQWEKARDIFERLTSEYPDFADAHHAWGWYLSVVEGDYANARSAAERAVAIDPDRLDYQQARAHHLYGNEDLEAALQSYRKIHQSNPDEWHAQLGAVRCLLELDKLDEAKEEAQKALDHSGRNAASLLAMVQVYASTGDRKGAEAIRDELLQRAGERYVPSIFLAGVHAALGDFENALQTLETAVDNREGGILSFRIRRPDTLKLFQDQPRYWALIDRMKLPGLPPGHPGYQREMEMRFGKVLTDRPVKEQSSD